MRDSDRYMAQADAVMRMASRAGSAAEREVYETIAEGWRKLAGEAQRNERRDANVAVSKIAPEPRSFR
jgi:hypothetical protein